MQKILKLGIVIVFLSSLFFHTAVAISEDEFYDFKAKIISVNQADSSIEIEHFVGQDRRYYKTIKIDDSTGIKKDDAVLKLADLKVGYKIFLSYNKDKDGNRMATSISVLSEVQ
ncbi:MAG: hypothetical protein V1674_05960 [Candidatus Omnitrophota bacterium]